MRVVSHIEFSIGSLQHQLTLLNNGSSSGNRSAYRKSFITQMLVEKDFRMKDYPVIFWIKEDFIESSMAKLFNQINEN